MDVKNLTPFPVIAWDSVDAKQNTFITTLVRVKYVFHPTKKKGQWELRLTPEQEEFFAKDIYYNDDINLPVRYESDFIAYKPNTDIIINGYARTLKENPNDKEPCGVLIADSNNEELIKLNTEIHCKAPWLDENLEEEKATRENYSNGLGIISRSHESRLSYAGTYDKNWLDNQHPYPPNDFNYLYNQAAIPELMLNGYIKTGTHIGLRNLLNTDSNDYFHLPELHCFSEFIPVIGDMERKLMNIDTVLINVRSTNPDLWAVFLSYRHFTPVTIPVKQIVMKYLPTEVLEMQNG